MPIDLLAGAVAVAMALVVEAALGWKIGPRATLPAYLYFGAVGVAVAVTDCRSRRIPNVVVLPSYGVLAALLAIGAGVDGRWSFLADAAVAMVGFLLAFALLAIVERGGMGAGDVKLAGLVGLAAGFLGPASALLAFVLPFALAAALLLVLRLGGRRPARLPFAPLMAAGAVLVILVH